MAHRYGLLAPALLLACAASAAARSDMRTGPWVLATADTRLTVRIRENAPFVERLECPFDPHNWAGPGMRVPLLASAHIGGRDRGIAWRYEGAVRDRAAGTLVLAFACDDPRLALRSIWRARPGPGPVEHWCEVENRAGERAAVGHQESLALLGLRPGRTADVWWIRRGGSNASTEGGTFAEAAGPGFRRELVSNCEDGASPVPWVAVQVGGVRGLYAGWEFSGLGRIEVSADGPDGALALRVGNLPDFRTDVEPGETFRVPPAFVGCYRGDVDAGSYSLHRFVMQRLRPRMPRGMPDPLLAYNLYLDAGGPAAREADVLRSARFCHDLGFEAFMPDAMWFPETGDWRWDPKRFPSGIAPVERYVHASGMKMALWCAWTNGGVSPRPDALSVRGPNGHPDWFRGVFAPDWQPGPFYGGSLCLGSPEAEAWAAGKTQWLAGHHRLDYLKHDCGPIVTNCDKATHRHHYGVDASYWAATGYYAVQERLRRAFPGLVLENCSGGGHIKDFGVVSRTHYTVTTDTLSNLPNRQSIYDSTFALPPAVLQAYTYDNYYPVKGDGPGPFLWRSAMMSAWQIDPTDTEDWTAEETESARRAVRIYKSWIRPMLRDVRVHHILPRPDGVRWDGMFYWCERLGRGTLYVFRPEAPDGEQTIRLKGLQRERRYHVWSEDGSAAPGVHTGAELMDHGITVRLPGPYTSDLVLVRDAALGVPRWPAKGSVDAEAPRRAPAAPAGVTFVSDLPWDRATAGADNAVHRDTNYYGRPIRVAGKRHARGVWTHAFADSTPADVAVTIAGKGFGLFAADAGVEDRAGGGSVQFQVLVDGRLAAESPVMRPGGAHHFRVDVKRARQVTLRVLNGGDGYTADHAAWGSARFIAAGAADPLGDASGR